MTVSPQAQLVLLEKAKTLSPLWIRLPLGVVFIAHGLDKLFGTFGGGGFDATVAQFTELGLQPAWFHAVLGGGGELLGGFLVLLGLLTRLGGSLIAATMVVAIITVHLSGGLFARDGGFEYPLVILGSALSLVFTGGGPLALDRLFLDSFMQSFQNITRNRAHD